MMSITVEENRLPPESAVLADDEHIRLFNSIISAYGGTHEVAGNTISDHVEMSWNEAWTGTDQVRHYSVPGDTLTIETTPRNTGTDGREFINTLNWKRVESLSMDVRLNS